ncbi:WD40 repeat-like protein [Suillus weaverae]|nr:WD40 repeat-like protein [Suillus weaverae]
MSSAAAKTNKTSVMTPRKTLRGHTMGVQGVAHLPDAQRIITCSYDGSLRLWDLESGAQIGDEWRDEEDGAAVRTMALSPNGKTVASGSQDGTVRLWDVETGQVVAKGTLSWWTRCPGVQMVGKFGKPVQGLNPIKTGHKHVLEVSYSPNATMIATGGFKEDGIKIWDAKTGKLLSAIKLEYAVWSFAWTLDEKKLIAGLRNGLIKIFRYCHFAADRRSGGTSWDHTARLWNLNTNLQVGSPLQHEDDVDCAAFSTDGKLLSTGCADKNAYAWDIQAILKVADLEDLISIPYAPKVEPKQKLYTSSGSSSIEHISPSQPSQDIEDKSFLEADATRGFGQFGDADGLLPGFFDDTQVNAHHSSATPGARAKFSALFSRFPTLGLRHSQSNQAIETQQPPVPLESRSHALLNRLSSLLRSPPNTDEISELQPPMPSRLSPQVLLGHLSSLLPRPRLYTNETTEHQRSQTSSGLRPGALTSRLSSLFHSPPNADEVIEAQHCPGPTTSSHCSPHDVEVAAMRDREVIFVARRPETASEKAKRIKNPKPWVRVVLFSAACLLVSMTVLAQARLIAEHRHYFYRV